MPIQVQRRHDPLFILLSTPNVTRDMATSFPGTTSVPSRCPSGSRPCGQDACAPIGSQCCGRAVCPSGRICAQSEINPTSTIGFCIIDPRGSLESRTSLIMSTTASLSSSVHLEVFSSSVPNNLVSVANGNPHTSGQITGIAIGSIAGFIFLVGGILLLLHRKRSNNVAMEQANEQSSSAKPFRPLGGRHEMPTEPRMFELAGSGVHEVGGEERPRYPNINATAAELDPSTR
jgi:hypothetical protein